MRRTLSIQLFILLFITLPFGHKLAAQETAEVFLNSQRLTPEQAQILELLVGVPLPSGRYWLDEGTGLWGYGDAPPQALFEADQTQDAPAEGTHYFEDEAAKYGFDIPPIQY